jgi:hypothetical protein
VLLPPVVAVTVAAALVRAGDETLSLGLASAPARVAVMGTLYALALALVWRLLFSGPLRRIVSRMPGGAPLLALLRLEVGA